MKTLFDPANALAPGLASIRTAYQVPAAFRPPVLAAAQTAARRALSQHVDRTAIPFVTLDPATSTDLDQAFAVEVTGPDYLLHYAIADVAWFVEDGGPLDAEAWKRGTTLYLPDGKAGLYPPIIAENAASLLPDGPRPAIIFTTRIGPDGEAKLESVERALIHSRAKLAYTTVRPEDLPPGFAELTALILAAEDRRGAARVDPPEQEVARTPEGRYSLAFRTRTASEDQNAALSLATNLAVADTLFRAKTGLFRVMANPSDKAVRRLRQTARAFGLAWPDAQGLTDFQRSLSAAIPAEAAFMLAIRRAGGGAAYMPWREGITPWHAPMAATYCHATAPLRRLADRYVIRAALAIANGQPVPETVTQAFEKLPAIMARADALSSQIDRAVIDFAEAVMLHGREGELFDALVTDLDERGLRIQLCDYPIVARAPGNDTRPGDRIKLRLTAAEPDQRSVTFERAG